MTLLYCCYFHVIVCYLRAVALTFTPAAKTEKSGSSPTKRPSSVLQNSRWCVYNVLNILISLFTMVQKHTHSFWYKACASLMLGSLVLGASPTQVFADQTTSS